MNGISKIIVQCFCQRKNSKWLYFVRQGASYLVPDCFFRMRRNRVLQACTRRKDYAYMLDRLEYYCPSSFLKDYTPELRRSHPPVPMSTLKLHDAQMVYFFDAYRFTRWFDRRNVWYPLFGDIAYVPEVPSITKSRPVVTPSVSNAFSVLLNLNRVRHFIFVRDTISFADKMDKVVFRGKVRGKQQRYVFMQKFYNHAWIDAGDVAKTSSDPVEWKHPAMSIKEHLRYKFILAIEGNDVASNLKWVMSSNSVAVMSRPTCETWFMEGRLIPDYHYIEVKSDFSDLEEKVQYYLAHPDLAQQIIDHAHEYVAQFRNTKRERLLGLMVMNRYVELLNKK